MSKKFVPKVILLGTEKDLPDFKIDYEIVGRLKIEIQNNIVRLFFNDQPINLEKFKQIRFDYVLCTDFNFYWQNKSILYQIVDFGKFASTYFFENHVSNVGFVCSQNANYLVQILDSIAPKNFDSVLDFDAYLYRGEFFDNPINLVPPTPPRIHELTHKFETIISEKIEPIFFNVYDRVFKTFDEMKMRSYDAIFFTAERSVEEWLEVLNWAIKSTRKIILYVHEDSEAFDPLKNLAISRAKIGYVKAIRGVWIVIESERPEICRAYVCFHKPYYMPKLPDGYIKIHAGKKLSNIDLGLEFIGDDTGDNISELNPFINELTATYWAWKNTRSDYVGFCHYSRYFVMPDNKSKPDPKNYVPLGYLPGGHILTMNEAIDLLKDCDIIVRNVSVFYSSYGDSFDNLKPNSVKKIGYDIFKKHISEQSPEYLPVHKEMKSDHFLIGNSVFFTRWKVFDEYCKWIFSFLIPAAREFASYNFETDRRTISYFGEDMFQLFVMHNNLRLKYVRMFAGGYESTQETFDSRKFY